MGLCLWLNTNQILSTQTLYLYDRIYTKMHNMRYDKRDNMQHDKTHLRTAYFKLTGQTTGSLTLDRDPVFSHEDLLMDTKLS